MTTMNINENKRPKDKAWAELFGLSNVVARLEEAKSRAYAGFKAGRKTAGARFDKLHNEISKRS